ncbi:MAG: polyprenyl synthetase family protein [Candidatus Omnitrophica bacterium]|nr:polyprenyl synthetase family protein [Candidatus Omnitrophota bacterium]
MNSLSTVSPSIDPRKTAPNRGLSDLLEPYQSDLSQVREMIAERIFRQEGFGELLISTGGQADWKEWDHPDWLLRLLESGEDSASKSTPLRMAEHLVSRGGKLYRATLILVIARTLAAENPKTVTLASALELIHLATLLHDDVIDNADLRRGKPSMPTLFDNAPAVLMGDHLYARAFEMLSECEIMRIVSATCRATSAMCRGEVEQLQWIGRHSIPEEAYFRLIEMKTAALIGCCSESTAVLCGREDLAEDWYRFGNTLGLVFQMADDLLDFTSDPETLGKQTGSDAADGKYTLPLILFRERIGGPEALKNFLSEAGGPEEIADRLREEGVLDQVRERILELQKICHEQLDRLLKDCRDDDSLEILHRLVDFTGSRTR